MVLDILSIAGAIGWNGNFSSVFRLIKIKSILKCARCVHDLLNSVCRVWWSGAIAVSMTFCAYSILHIWSAWRNDPIVLTPETKLQSIGTVPFPGNFFFGPAIDLEYLAK